MGMGQKSKLMGPALFSLLLGTLFAIDLQGGEVEAEVGVKTELVQSYGYCTPVPCYHTPAGLCYCCPKWKGCPLNFDSRDKCLKECPK